LKIDFHVTGIFPGCCFDNPCNNFRIGVFTVNVYGCLHDHRPWVYVYLGIEILVSSAGRIIFPLLFNLPAVFSTIQFSSNFHACTASKKEKSVNPITFWNN
jgi:hypothetical protein